MLWYFRPIFQAALPPMTPVKFVYAKSFSIWMSSTFRRCPVSKSPLLLREVLEAVYHLRPRYCATRLLRHGQSAPKFLLPAVSPSPKFPLPQTLVSMFLPFRGYLRPPVPVFPFHMEPRSQPVSAVGLSRTPRSAVALRRGGEVSVHSPILERVICSFPPSILLSLQRGNFSERTFGSTLGVHDRLSGLYERDALGRTVSLGGVVLDGTSVPHLRENWARKKKVGLAVQRAVRFELRDSGPSYLYLCSPEHHASRTVGGLHSRDVEPVGGSIGESVW